MDIKINENPKETAKKIVGTYIDITTYNKLQEEADKNFTSLSSLVRKILYHYVHDQNDNEE